MAIDTYSLTSRNGYPVDLLVSALQKFIRRGMARRAVHVAFELSMTSLELENYVWRRLLVIASEDIGGGCWEANSIVKDLYDSAQILYEPGSTADRYIVMANAIRFLCQCKKERCSCLMNDIIKRQVINGEKIELPDYVYDMHTREGQKRGRDYNHFLNEAALVIPHVEGECEDKELEKELLALIEAKKNER